MKSWVRNLFWVLGVAVLLAIGVVAWMIVNGPINPQLSDTPTETPTEEPTEPPVADPVRQQMQEGVSCPLADLGADWSPTLSAWIGLPLTVELEPMQQGAEVTLEVWSSGGSLLQDPDNPRDNPWKQAVLFDHFTAENGKNFYWNPSVYWFDENDKVKSDYNLVHDYVYVDIIVREGENIVGFAVVKIWMVDENACSYRPTVIKNVRYSMVDGKYQNVALETVQQDIAQAKQEHEQAQ